MEWKFLLEKRIKAGRQILFSKDDEEILSLMLLINEHPRKAVILWALELAEETADVANYHAVGQACGTVHANGHTIGYPIYDLTSMIREKGLDHCDDIIHDRIGICIKKLLYWKDHYMDGSYQWAEFIRNCCPYDSQRIK